MNHNEIKEKLILFVYEEIPENEKNILEDHLQNCAECREEFENLLKFYSKSKNEFPVNDEFLSDARRELRKSLYEENERKSFSRNIFDELKLFFSKNYAYAFASISFLVIGFLAGYLIFSQNENADQNFMKYGNSSKLISQNDEAILSDTKISDFRFIDSDASDGEIEFSFYAVKPMQIKGNINDESIQKLLAYSLMNQDNDGIKLRTIGAISSQPKSQIEKDDRIKDALISTLKNDQNAGVRREALLALEKFDYDEKVKDVILSVLSNDENPGLRIAAIKILNSRTEHKNNLDDEIIKVLENKSENDNNNFVRVSAKSLLEEAKQNEL